MQGNAHGSETASTGDSGQPLNGQDDRAYRPLPSFDLAAWLGPEEAAEPPAQPGKRGRRGLPAPATQGGNGGIHHADNRVERARAYVMSAGFPESVAGDFGHGSLFRCACVLIDEFGLNRNDALIILGEYNQAKGKPPEDDYQLNHKIDQAEKKHPKPSLKLLMEERAGTNGHHPQVVVIDIPETQGRQLPIVEVNPVEMGVNNQVCNLLAENRLIYQRNRRLVEFVPQKKTKKIPTGIPSISTIALPRLREIISVVATFIYKRKIIHPPDWCVSAIHKRPQWDNIPILTSVVEHPCIRMDGTMVEKPGYDEETGIMWASSEGFDPIPEQPNQDDARAAARRILTLVNEFPFEGKTVNGYSPSEAAWLSCLLTILNRHLIDGPTPLFFFEANVSSAGKTLLCDIIGRVATGRDMIRSSYYHDSIEMDKQITAIALAGIRITMLDNVNGPFGNSALDNALTGRYYRGRILGQSEMTDMLLLDTVFVGTGNNISLNGDMFRRMVRCRIESPYERPDREKTKFAIPNICEHASLHRSEFLRDAMILMRAYIQAGCPHTLPTNTYGAWARLIRGAVVWAIDMDPLRDQADIISSDSNREANAGLIEGFEELLKFFSKKAMTCSDILRQLGDNTYAGQFDTIRESMSTIWPRAKPLPAPGALGKRFMSIRGMRSGDARIIAIDKEKRTIWWGVQVMNKVTNQWEGDFIQEDKLGKVEYTGGFILPDSGAHGDDGDNLSL